MKRYILRITSFIFIIFLFSFLTVNAATDGVINPKDYGQSHSYSVLMRGNGEAVIWSTIQITNGEELPVSQLVLKTGNLTPRLFEAWQEIEIMSASAPARCRNAINTSTTTDFVIVKDQFECRSLFGNNYSYIQPIQGKLEYRYNKLTIQQSGKTVTFALAKPIDKNTKGTIITSYRGFGVVDEGFFGRMKFDFQTLETASRVRSIDVVVNVDTDLYIKGDKANVSYVESTPKIFSESADYSGIGSAPTSGIGTMGMALEPVSYRIGRDTTSTSIKKSTSDLLGGDVFHVRGVYASSWFGIYWTKLIIGLLIVLAVIIMIILGVRLWRMRHPMNINLEGETSSQVSPAKPVGMHAWWSALVIGFLNAVGTIMLALGTPFVFSFFEDMMRYNNSGISIAFMILLPLSGFLIYGSLVFAPSIYFGNKYGRNYGFLVFGSQLGFLFLLSFSYMWIIHVLSISGGSSSRYY